MFEISKEDSNKILLKTIEDTNTTITFFKNQNNNANAVQFTKKKNIHIGFLDNYNILTKEDKEVFKKYYKDLGYLIVRGNSKYPVIVFDKTIDTFEDYALQHPYLIKLNFGLIPDSISEIFKTISFILSISLLCIGSLVYAWFTFMRYI